MNKDHSKVRAEARREGTKTLLEFHAERATRNVSPAPSAQWRQQRAEHGAACVPFEADATEPSGRPVCAARAVGEAGARKAFRGLWHEAPTVLSQAPERAPVWSQDICSHQDAESHRRYPIKKPSQLMLHTTS